MTIKVVTYRSLQPGQTLTVLGAVHGNEPCGAAAINRLIAGLDRGEVVLKQGTLQLVPVCNPRAYAGNVRFVERNLNRSLYPKDNPVHYEDRIDPILCEVLDRSSAVLDLHSYASQGGPFMFLSAQNTVETQFAYALGVTDFVCGWAEAFSSHHGGNDGSKEGQGTTEYARLKGAIAVTLECGHHKNADAPDIGYRAILLGLKHLDMLDPDCAAAKSLKPANTEGRRRYVRMQTVHRRPEGAELAKPWIHFDPVKKGEPMAKLANGDTWLAPTDGYIVLPKSFAKAGEEWFYFGEALSSI